MAGTPPSSRGVGGVVVTDTPSAGEVLTADSATAASWQAASSGAFTLITDSLLAAPGTFDFLAIAGTYKHLQIELQVRATNAAATIIAIRFNNDSAANYGSQILQANAGVASAAESIGATDGRIGSCPGTASGASGAMTLHIPNYAAATLSKVFIATGGRYDGTGAGSTILEHTFGWWNNTAAVARVTIFPGAGATFVTGSRATLYGLA